MDARRGQVYAALFETDGGKIRRVMEDTALSVEDLKKRVENHKKKVILIGDGAGLCYNAFGLKADTFLAPPHLRYQNAVGVAMEGRGRPARGGIGRAAYRADIPAAPAGGARIKTPFGAV